MKKYVVLSVNDNPDYLYFTPLTCWAWRQFGWEPIVFFYGDIGSDVVECSLFGDHGPFPINTRILKHIDGYRADTITQISRLYGSCMLDDPNAYLMTCDIDMIPLSDYWKPSGQFTVWGHDLTGFKNFPICYIGAPAQSWAHVMKLEGNDYNTLIKRDLDTLPQAKSNDFYQYWETDQDLITARLKAYGTPNINFINRGQGKHGFPRGRVDKGHGGWVLDQPELIDAHLLQQCHHSEEKIRKLMDLLHHVWPKEDFKWWLTYTKEFKKLAG